MDVRSTLDHAGRMQIPIIDLGPFLGGAPGAEAATAGALREACEGLGFFFVRNHGVDQALIDMAFAACQRFHSLPLEHKMASRAAGKVVGYLPLGGQTQRTSVHGKSVAPDLSASFYVRQEFAADHPDRLAGQPWVFDNRWPADLPVSIRRRPQSSCLT